MRRPSLENVTINTCLIMVTYAATSVVLGYGFSDPVIDAVGLTSTGVVFTATRRGMSRIGRDLGLE